MSSQEVVSFPEVNIARMIEGSTGQYENVKQIFQFAYLYFHSRFLNTEFLNDYLYFSISIAIQVDFLVTFLSLFVFC